MESEILRIYKSFADDVFRFCMFKLNNKEQAEDITSETFLKLAEQDISKIENPKAWLITVSRNKMYDHFRKKTELLLDEGKSEIIRDDFVLENVVLNEMQAEDVLTEIRKLDEKASEIIILRIWEELPFKEIAEIMKENEANVKMKFYRGIEKLKNNMKGAGKSTEKVLSVSFIMGAIFSISKQSSFAMSQTFANSLQASILSITNSAMIGGTIAADGVAATGSALSASAAKIFTVVVGTIAIAGGSVGTAYIINEARQENNSSNEIVLESNDNSSVREEEEEVREQACDLQTYTNATFPNFSFQYNECEWDVSEVIVAKESDLVPDGLNILLTKGKNELFIELNSFLTYGTGIGQCKNVAYEIFQAQNLVKGRYTSDNNENWMYVFSNMMSYDDYVDLYFANSESVQMDMLLDEWNFNPNLDGFCSDLTPDFTKTNFKNVSELLVSDYVSATVAIHYSGDNQYLEKADEVVQTLVTSSSAQ